MANKRIAIVGIQGLPAKYGGFETLVANLVNNMPEDVELKVWCSSKEYSEKLRKFGRAHLGYLPFRANGWQGIIMDMVAIIRSKNFDKILVLGVNGALTLLCPRIANRVVLNIGGLDYNRSKWGLIARKTIYVLNYIAVRRARYLISDNEKIKNYLYENFNRESYLIGYGHSIFDEIADSIDLQNKGYFLNIARIQHDNNCHIILSAFRRLANEKLVMIGNFSSSKYGRDLFQIYSDFPNITLMEAVYDVSKLRALFRDSKGFVHGHSAGGTNPILVDYMSQSKPILAFVNGFNQHTLGIREYSWSSEEELVKIIATCEYTFVDYSERLKELNWVVVSEKYFSVLCQ